MFPSNCSSSSPHAAQKVARPRQHLIACFGSEQGFCACRRPTASKNKAESVNFAQQSASRVLSTWEGRRHVRDAGASNPVPCVKRSANSHPAKLLAVGELPLFEQTAVAAPT